MKFIKNNFIFLFISILFIFLFIAIYNNINKYVVSEEKSMNEIVINCKENITNLPDGEYKIYCEEILSNPIIITSKNFYVKFFTILLENVRFLNMFACLILFIMSIYGVSSIFKSKVALLMLKREKLSIFVINIIKKMYRYVWFFPIVFLIIFIICSINSTFDANTLINQGFSWGESLMNNVPLFIFVYLLNLLLYSGFYLNIALIVVRKQHNYFLAVIESFLLIIAIQLFFEIVINALLFGKILKDNSTGLVFNIMNLFNFNVPESRFGLFGLLLFSFLCFFISFLIVIYMFKDKEKLVIDCEKNV